jgi:hypothetical protein
MPTPSELVTDSFAQAHTWVNEHRTQLASFITALNDAVQLAPLTDIAFNPIADPGTFTVAPYEAPADYASDLSTQAKTTLTTRLAGGTGLDPSVEGAIWDRARERELAAHQATIDQVTRDSEALGWQLPPGVLVDSIRRETVAYFDKSAGISREVAIEQARLEQTNLRETLSQAITLEQMLADVNVKRSQVALDTYRANIQRFVAEVEQDVKHWEAQIKQYEAQITFTLTAEKTQADIIRGNSNALLEAAKTGAQVLAQLTASAYSIIKASAQVDAGSRMSVSYQYSNDTLTAPPAVTSV